MTVKTQVGRLSIFGVHNGDPTPAIRAAAWSQYVTTRSANGAANSVPPAKSLNGARTTAVVNQHGQSASGLSA